MKRFCKRDTADETEKVNLLFRKIHKNIKEK